MAKTAKKIELRYITDAGHGWAEVSDCLAKSLGLGTDFTSRNGMLYLEEDCEMGDLERALKRKGYAPSFVECYVDDFDAWLEADAWPNIPEGESVAKKTTKKGHHPDYEPDIACGSLYVQKEVAVQMMLAIAYALKHNKAMTKLDKQRLRVGATVINDVFSLGAEGGE